MKLRPFFIIHAFAALLVGVLLSGCIFGGTGTDTENGVGPNETMNKNPKDVAGAISAQIFDASHKPLAGVKLIALPVEFRPDSNQNVDMFNQIVPLVTSQKTVVSDAKGWAGFTLRSSGTFLIEGSINGTPLFFDTLKITDNPVSQTLNFTASPLGNFAGNIKLASGMHIDSGLVFIRGTQRFVRVNVSGAYTLGSLPTTVEHMGLGIRYAASPTAVLQVVQTFIPNNSVKDSTKIPVVLVKADSLKVVYTCNDVAKDSAVKIIQVLPVTQVVSAGKPISAGSASSPLDSTKVNAALKSCDSLAPGSIVNIKPPDPELGILASKVDSVGGVFVVTSKTLDSNYQVISYNTSQHYTQCLEKPGTEKTSFNISLAPSAMGNDMVVGDIGTTCLTP